MTALIGQARQTAEVATKRHRPNKVELQARRDKLVQLADEARPASVRHLYYRMVAAGFTEKSESGYDKVVYDLGILRDQGRVPYWWIVDNGRRGHFPLVDPSPGAALRNLALTYARDPWQDPDGPRVEIWAESRSIAGVLMQLKDQYAVPIYPTGGQASESFVYESARSYDPGERVVVLYAGDYDPAGLQCGAQLEAKLRKHADPTVMIEFRWLSITADQAETLQQLGTTPKQRHWKDRHGGRHEFVGQAIELEAIDPNLLRRLFAEAIEEIARDHYGSDIFSDNRVIERGERAEMRALAREWNGGGRDA